jgi:hypothetical protein
MVTPPRKQRCYQRMVQPENPCPKPRKQVDNHGNGPRPVKRKKSRLSMSLPGKVDGARTAWPHDNPHSRNSIQERRSENAGDDDTGPGQVVTFWSSRWSAWVIDLTGQSPRHRGSTKPTTKNCGATDECE